MALDRPFADRPLPDRAPGRLAPDRPLPDRAPDRAPRDRMVSARLVPERVTPAVAGGRSRLPRDPARRSAAATPWLALMLRIRLLPVVVGLAVLSFFGRAVELLDPAIDLAPGGVFAVDRARAAGDGEAEADAAGEGGADGAAADGAPPTPDPAVTPNPELVATDEEDIPDFTRSEVAVLIQLKQRREALDAREKAVLQREALVQAAEARLALKVVELQTLKSELEALMGQRAEADRAKIMRLVNQFNAMKPKDAARIFNAMAPEELVPVVEKMPERKSAPIIAAMDTDKAETLLRHLMTRIGGQPGDLPVDLEAPAQ